jgi:hypothetical protein
MTTWDSREDAREFAAAYAQYQGERFGLIQPPPPAVRGAREEAQEAQEGAQKQAAAAADHFADLADQTLRRTAAGKVLHIELRGTDVAIVEGFDEADTQKLAAAAMAAQKQELNPVK